MVLVIVLIIFLISVIKCQTKSNLTEESFVLAYSLTGCKSAHHGGEAMAAGTGDYIASTGRSQRVMNAYAQLTFGFLLVFNSRSWGYDGFSPSVNLLKKPPYRYARDLSLGNSRSG